MDLKINSNTKFKAIILTVDKYPERLTKLKDFIETLFSIGIEVEIFKGVNGEEIIMNVPFVISGVEFDPERHLISGNSTIALGNQIFDLDDVVSIYPNPSSDVIHIQMPTTIALGKVTVYNNLGQIVLENTTSDFSVTTLSSGVHYIDIQTSEGTYHKKFIKK